MSYEYRAELNKIWAEFPKDYDIGVDARGRRIRVYNALEMEEWVYGKLEAFLIERFPPRNIVRRK